MSKQLTLKQVREIVHEMEGKSADECNILCDKIKAGGWRLRARAYQRTARRTANGRFLLKKPRNEWWVSVSWVRDEESVWSHDLKAMNKMYAIDMQGRYF
jgi:hypothetical protein